MDRDADSLNVLSFDVGGVRGLSSLLIIRSIMQQLGIRVGCKTDMLPCEVFDLICSTFTGGLTALLLGRLRMSVGDAIHCYLNFSKTVFQARSTGTQGLSDLRASISEEWVKNIVAEREGDGLTPWRIRWPGRVEAITLSWWQLPELMRIPAKAFSVVSDEVNVSGRVWNLGSGASYHRSEPFLSPNDDGYTSSDVSSEYLKSFIIALCLHLLNLRCHQGRSPVVVVSHMFGV